MLTTNKLTNMLQLQNKMNNFVSPDWIKKGWPFLRAAFLESGEAMDHHGWKWWKFQEKNIPQLQIELVDIFHFILSDFLINNNGDIDLSTTNIMKNYNQTLMDEKHKVIVFDGKEYPLLKMNILDKIELLAGLFVSRRVSLMLLDSIMKECDMSWDTLYLQYVGKNTLNIFRQEHGYKNNTYKKMWHGREDNEHLYELLKTMDLNNQNFSILLFDKLEEIYKTL